MCYNGFVHTLACEHVCVCVCCTTNLGHAEVSGAMMCVCVWISSVSFPDEIATEICDTLILPTFYVKDNRSCESSVLETRLCLFCFALSCN